MELWQIALLTIFVTLPIAFLFDFWPNRDRLSSRGEPIEREWIPQIEHGPADEDHH